FVHPPLATERVTEGRVGDRCVWMTGQRRTVVSGCFGRRTIEQRMPQSNVGPKIGRMGLLYTLQERGPFTTNGPQAITERQQQVNRLSFDWHTGGKRGKCRGIIPNHWIANSVAPTRGVMIGRAGNFQEPLSPRSVLRADRPVVHGRKQS